MASIVDGHHLDCPPPFPSPSDACSVGEVVAEEPLATILPSPEEGLSVFFLSGSPPRTPSPTTLPFDHQRGNLHHYNHQYHQQRYHDRHKHHHQGYDQHQHLAAGAPMDNRCVIAITQPKEGDFEAVGEDGGSAIHKGTSSKDCDGRLGTMGRCVIPVVSDKEVGHFEMERQEGEITQRQPYSRDWLTSREPSARIVLKGAIAFTHDGEGTDEQAYRKNRDTAQVVDELTGEICRHLTDKNRGVSIGDVMTDSCSSSYLESYLPEAPPRRSRSRNRVCSDSSVYITGDDDVLDHQSASHDLSGEGRYGSSLVITLSYNQHDEDERFLLPCDPADTEDDSVFAGYLPDSQTNASDITDMYRTSKPPSKKRYSASDFIRDTIWAPLDKQSDFNNSVQAEYSTQPIYANVPETQPERTTHKHTSQDYYFESRTEKESKHSETNLNLPPRENLESSAINEANKCTTKRKQSEKRMVNIEFITRPLPPSSDEASAIPSPPPRTKSPSKKKKSRARSSSPPKSDTTNDFPHPRRARSCCLHYREGLRLQEYLQENGITPTSLLDSFFESGMVEDDLGQLSSDFKFCQLYQNMSALQMAAEGRDYLMWCPDHEFDNAVAGLDIRGLVELVQTLQDAMAVEQQTFDSLSQQLELVYDPLQQQRLSAALCTSQTRLARLCSRNMRCFRQQALKARQKEGLESRSSSPRDSGLVMSSSDAEGDPRSPSGASFRSSLAFFQRAAHLVANNTKNSRARHKEARRRSSRGSSSYGSSSSEASEDPSADPIGSGAFDGGPGETGFEEDLMARFEDQGTYEQVLFINGRPQYPEDLSWTCDTERNSGNSGGGGRRPAGVAAPSLEPQLLSAAHSYPATVRRAATDSLASAAEAQTQTQAEDVGGYVTLPRRKPYLNFKSVSSAASSGGAELDNEDLRYCRDRIGVGRKSDISTITRAQSFKEGLNCYSNDYPNSAYGLSRTRSFHDGLASDFNELESVKPKLQRAPSVDEILESVKSLRAKKTMVKSTPDLLSAQEPVYHSASLPRHKGSKGKSSSKASGTSSLLGVRYNSSSNPPKFDRVPEPDYEQIPEVGTPYYENVCRGNNDYENVHLKGEVIYDSPRPTEHHYDKVHNDLHYENVKFDAAVYENLDEKEPTYMNIHGNKSNVYANLDANSKSGSLKSSKSRLNKVTISGNSLVQGTTYDVPRAATHIYDSPQKQIRSVGSTQTSEYDTPKNNRSVLPQSTQIVLKAKSEQKMKIDEIFADCDLDSLEGDRDRQPDIPSPDYGSEDEADGYEDASNDYVTTEFPDEGLGESDTRSYYAEDPAGLEVILEEPEEEYCSSHASEDDLQREVDITYGLKGERRSLDGSEGIGSAEGDTQSTGGSEHYVEEDCASSGIHSEDTPSPGPPADSEKEDGHRHHQHQQHQQEEEKQKAEEDRAQQDRCVEVYPETVRQRQRNMMASSGKVDIKNWNSSGNNNNNESQMSPAKVKKFLPSVKALRNQFEAGKTNNRSESNGGVTNTGNGTLSHRSSGSTSSLASSTLEKTSSTNSLNSASDSMENLLSPSFENQRQVDPEEPVEPIFNQFKKVDEELKDLMSRPPSTTGWNPRPLLKRLYYTPEVPKIQSQGTTYINIEGFLEKLPSGRKKATFWNAWKRRYFVAKDGVLYYYQNTQAEKPSMKMTLMGGKVECMEPNMIGVDDGNRDSRASGMLGIDDGKGHYVVVRCSSRQEAERWRRALETHTVEDFASQYVQPWPMPTSPALLRDTLVIDLGSASVRAGVLASQATLPQVFLPSVVATERETRRQVWGFDALAPDVRAASSVSFPIRPSHKITKYSVDLSAISSLLQKTFADLKVDPKNYHIQLSVPRVLNNNTQTELLRVLFDKFGVRSVNLTHQSILALYAYNATSGIVVDIGERMDIVPVIDGYIVDGGVSRVPYGGYRILDHLRQFLYMRNVSLINEVESYIIRHVLENICYCAHHYNTEKARCTNNPDLYEKDVSLAEYFHTKDCPFETISLDFGRFQATEGLFNPDAWGLDHPGLHKLVHKAIMECSMDIRKEMSRSIFLAGGVTQLPGLVDRLTTEIDNLTPPAIRPKVHASPYRYHAAYIGACVLAESPAFVQSRISREDWNKHGNAALRKWSL